MDMNTLLLAICAGLTIVGVIVTAVLWRMLKMRTRLHWLGWSLLPLAIWFLGLAPKFADAYHVLKEWVLTTSLDTMGMIGAVLGVVGIVLIVISRVMPTRPRKKKDETISTPPPAAPSTNSSLNVP